MDNAPKGVPKTECSERDDCCEQHSLIGCVLVCGGSGAPSGVLWSVIVFKVTANVTHIGSLLTNAATGAAKTELLSTSLPATTFPMLILCWPMLRTERCCQS